MNNLTFLAQMWQRLQTSSPAFFKKLQIILGVAGAALGIFYTILKLGVPIVDPAIVSKIETILAFVLTAVGGMLGTSFLPTTDASLADPKFKQNVIDEATSADTTTKSSLN